MEDNHDTMKNRTFMRGKVKNARAEELLALLKAEREISDIEKTEIPNALMKRPLLPAIRQTSSDEISMCSEAANFPVTKLKSRFLWKDVDWEEKDEGKTWNSEKRRRGSESFIQQKEYWGYENTTKNLPPLKTRRRCSQGVVRPSCPEPPMTPSFDESSQ